MMKKINPYALTALAGALFSLPASADLVPNGDFSSGQTSWEEVGVGGTYAFTYPDSGGNPDAYGVIDHSTDDGGFGLWVADDGSIIPLASLGLTAGQTYAFFQDMIILSGANIGRLKLEFYTGTDEVLNTGEDYPDLIDGGTSWQTYTLQVEIPSSADGVKFVPLWGEGSMIGYDNIGFNPTAIQPAAELFTADIEIGTVMTWIPEGSELIHQPQSSDDGIEWDNIGAAIIGDTPNSLFVSGDAPFYRVAVLEGAMEEAVQNGSFEFEGEPDCAEGWSCFSPTGQPPTRITTDSRTDDSSMRIAVNNEVSSPNVSEIQHNTGDAGGFIIPGESYDFSFWAKQISSSGVSHEQRSRLQWFDDGGAILGETSFDLFSGGDGVWKKISTTDLVPPDGTVSAFIQIFGATGAITDAEEHGEVLIDDVSLAISSITPFDEINAELADGLQVSWDTEAGMSYQVQASATDLDGFVDFGAPISGDGESASTSDLLETEAKFYRVLKTTP